MVNRKDSNIIRRKRHKGIRNKIFGTAECPRLNVYRSLKNIYAQLIDDNSGATLVAVSTLQKEYAEKYGGNKDIAKQIGISLAKSAIEKGIKDVVFDRGGYIYHGRVKAVAEGAREGGLNF
jgi:large subunit ribosomal protein L18